ncbi:MAG: hypothetical protein HON23_02140 [Rickettsiales bacterium]|jgi:hypothetical protein|nr:hypothetical protein [Rickettsiales bacterium]
MNITHHPLPELGLGQPPTSPRGGSKKEEESYFPKLNNNEESYFPLPGKSEKTQSDPEGGSVRKYHEEIYV